MTKQKKYYPKSLKVFITVAVVIASMIAAWLVFRSLGFVYQTVEYDNGTEATFVGKVNLSGKHISGKVTMPSGEIITFQNGEMHRANGDKYVGEYDRFEYHGKGTLYLASGDVYEGEFLNNLMNGWGKYTWSEGRTYEGVFENGVIVRIEPEIPDAPEDIVETPET